MHLILTHFCNKSEKTARGTKVKGGPHRGGRGEAGSGNRLPEGGRHGAERRAKPVGPLLKRFAGAAALGRGPQNAQLENRRGKRGAEGRAKSAGPFLKAPPGRRLCRRPRGLKRHGAPLPRLRGRRRFPSHPRRSADPLLCVLGPRSGCTGSHPRAVCPRVCAPRAASVAYGAHSCRGGVPARRAPCMRRKAPSAFRASGTAKRGGPSPRGPAAFLFLSLWPGVPGLWPGRLLQAKSPWIKLHATGTNRAGSRLAVLILASLLMKLMPMQATIA